MHHGDWNNNWGGGSWWWIPMALMMVAFWGGLIWIAVNLIRRSGEPRPPTSDIAAPATARPSALEILAERLARGEIEPDEYRQRLEALQPTPRE
ncbi:MAG: SHOCT domain-containing protein [Actinomycetota bacterium]